jgi:hypothetical protein
VVLIFFWDLDRRFYGLLELEARKISDPGEKWPDWGPPKHSPIPGFKLFGNYLVAEDPKLPGFVGRVMTVQAAAREPGLPDKMRVALDRMLS